MGRLKTLKPLLLTVVLFAAAGGNAYAQQSGAAPDKDRRRAVSYTFVSPNTREGLKLEEAIRLLNSEEEFRLVGRVRKLSRCLGLRPSVARAIGSWSDGAEHSALFRVYADRPTLRYADARLGKHERQKTVLFFRRDAAGSGRMFVFRARARGRKGLASISKTLDESGVAFRTLVPRPRHFTIVYVVDLENALGDKVYAAARRLGGRPVAIRGAGEFMGDDADRDRAQEVFGQEIKNYEDGRPSVARRCRRE